MGGPGGEEELIEQAPAPPAPVCLPRRRPSVATALIHSYSTLLASPAAALGRALWRWVTAELWLWESLLGAGAAGGDVTAPPPPPPAQGRRVSEIQI